MSDEPFNSPKVVPSLRYRDVASRATNSCGIGRELRRSATAGVVATTACGNAKRTLTRTWGTLSGHSAVVVPFLTRAASRADLPVDDSRARGMPHGSYLNDFVVGKL
jgi:hypothetical protein